MKVGQPVIPGSLQHRGPAKGRPGQQERRAQRQRRVSSSRPWLEGGREGGWSSSIPARGSQMRGLALTPAAELFLPSNGCSAGAGAGTGAAAPLSRAGGIRAALGAQRGIQAPLTQHKALCPHHLQERVPHQNPQKNPLNRLAQKSLNLPV